MTTLVLYFADDHLYINCGGEQVSINDNNYEADLQPDGGSTFFLSGNKSWAYSSMGIFSGADRNNYIVQKTCNISMVDAPLYKTARVSPISLKYYGFCLKNDVYIVKLHFAEIAWEVMKNTSSKGKRAFDVEIQGEKKLSNFNIEAEAEGLNKDKTMEYNVSVNDNRLEIHLYWTGKGSISDTIKYYGPLISAISVSPVPRNKASSRLSVVHIVGIVGSFLLFFIFILGVLWKLGCFGVKKLHDEELSRIELFPGGVFNFRQIKAATQNFSTANKLGEGGFGTVYKGILPKGPIIAVKQLSTRSKQGIREFVNEISTISALQHPHLVRLMGCCAEDNQLLLVYEYMENNSLAHALFGAEELKLELNWPTRVKICLGIAKGLAFLHEESKLKIVHRDIKPTNILLDEHFNAKISDFGFAKLYEEEKTHVITRIAGTTPFAGDIWHLSMPCEVT
ncbi:unnamed protein product [Ilex paraguariensis]|uniref:non-specific serine/threonine protein kinase n=1 Tax=Ilex paraguariensis TaxID=185542 RepID=A0ABC8S156_9AQUA